jgi:hypothetical protein
VTYVDQATATRLALEKLDEIAQRAGINLQLLSDRTREIEAGWVFFYNSSEFLRTRNLSHALAGNGPIFVTREGAVHQLPTAIPWQEGVKRI